MEQILFLVGIALLLYPSVYLFGYKAEDLRQAKKGIYDFMQYYLIATTILYGTLSVLGVYFNSFQDDIFTHLFIILFLTSALYLTKLRFDGLSTKIYLLALIVYIFALTLTIFKIFYTPIEKQTSLIPVSREESGAVAIILILIILVPLIILYAVHLYLKKRAVRLGYTLTIKELRIVTIYFVIVMTLFGAISLIALFFTYEGFLFSGDIFDQGIGEKISAIFYEVLNDPLFMFTTIITMIAGFTTVVGNIAYRSIGYIVMAMMPMIMWLSALFGDVPKEVVDLFLGFDLLARIFYILIVMMLLVIVITAWRLFTGIVEM